MVIALIVILIFWNVILNTNNLGNSKYKFDPQVFKYYNINNSELDGFSGHMMKSTNEFYFIVEDELSHSKLELYTGGKKQKLADRINRFEKKAKNLGFKIDKNEKAKNAMTFRNKNSFLKIELFHKEGEDNYTLRISEIYENRGNDFYSKIMKWPDDRFHKIIERHQYKIIPN